jgi:Zn-finger nucleic acid-binding protein
VRCTRCLNVHLVAEEFRGQLIEVCPRCHGVWLPRADFDRLVAGADKDPPPPRRRRSHDHRDDYYSDDDVRYDRRASHDSSGRLPAQGRRRSWLHGISELFD